jgi:hypothetical protein
MNSAFGQRRSLKLPWQPRGPGGASQATRGGSTEQGPGEPLTLLLMGTGVLIVGPLGAGLQGSSAFRNTTERMVFPACQETSPRV